MNMYNWSDEREYKLWIPIKWNVTYIPLLSLLDFSTKNVYLIITVFWISAI